MERNKRLTPASAGCCSAGVGPFALVQMANAVNSGLIKLSSVPSNIPLAQFLPVVQGAGVVARNMQPYFMLQANKC